MKRKTRNCPGGILIHCYQNTVNGNVLFYTVSDYLAFFTTLCISARRYGVRILSLCLMPDHVHQGIIAENGYQLSSYVRDYSTACSKSHNKVFHEKGHLFNRPFGSAPKFGAKKSRTLLAYIGNNPVERRLCARAEQYRWNFLAYAKGCHPFSERLVVRRASYRMRLALKEVRGHFRLLRPLSYNLLQRLFKDLDDKERNQLTDYIISMYSVIDYESAIKYYGSYEEMLIAFHSNTGSEYDIKETVDGRSDLWYGSMTNFILKKLQFRDIHDIFHLGTDEKYSLFEMLRKKSDCPAEQICKYLHLRLHKGGSLEMPAL